MNGGHAGNLVAPAISLTKAEAGFRVIQGITSVAGTYTGGSDRVSGTNSRFLILPSHLTNNHIRLDTLQPHSPHLHASHLLPLHNRHPHRPHRHNLNLSPRKRLR